MDMNRHSGNASHGHNIQLLIKFISDNMKIYSYFDYKLFTYDLDCR